MSHPTTIGHALWDALRTFYRDFRRAVATKQEHSGPALVVSGDFDEVQAALGRQHFAPNWEFSYNKRGEELNLARITYERREVGHHEYGWWQTHVRGWAQDNGSMRLRAHWELEPTENDQDHIDGIGLDVPAGVDQTARALDAEDVAYQRYDNLPAGGE